MTAIIIVYLIVLAATIYLGYRLNVLRWRKRRKIINDASSALAMQANNVSRGLSDLSSTFTIAAQCFPRLCNDGKFRSFTKEHDEMIEHNTLKYREMKFGEITDKNHARKLVIAETEGSK